MAPLAIFLALLGAAGAAAYKLVDVGRPVRPSQCAPQRVVHAALAEVFYAWCITLYDQHVLPEQRKWHDLDCAIDVGLLDKQAFLIHCNFYICVALLGSLRSERRSPVARIVLF